MKPPARRRGTVDSRSPPGRDSDDIKNYSFHPFRRCAVDVGCDYGADIDETRRVLEKALAGLEHALEEPPPQVFLKGLGGSSVDWQLRAWANQDVYWDVHQEMVRKLERD